MVHGPPAGGFKVMCTKTRIPAEVWVYDGSEQVRETAVLVFIKRRPARAPLEGSQHPARGGSRRGQRRDEDGSPPLPGPGLKLMTLCRIALALGVAPAELVPGLAARPVGPGLIRTRRPSNHHRVA